jgi:sister chromatid cohesion protein DCC1
VCRKRARWGLEELLPYLADVAEPGQTVESLLLKFTRRTQPDADATPIFSAR